MYILTDNVLAVYINLQTIVMKKLLQSFYILTTLTYLLSLTSCSKEKTEPFNPVAGMYKIASGTAGSSGITIDIYAKHNKLYTGYNKLYFIATAADGNRMQHANITLQPMMDMGMMQHSSPFENPQEHANNDVFNGSVVFTMPSTAGDWTLNVSITDPSTSVTGIYSAPLIIESPTESRIKSFISAHNSERFYVALIEPATPIIGINDFEVAIYKNVSMMSYPADSSLTVMHTPEMPTMGHGSPNNVHPVHIGNGHYKGKVNFTMTGYWKVNMDFLHGTEVADTTQSFDITF